MACKRESRKWVRTQRGSIMGSRSKDECLEMGSVNGTSLCRPCIWTICLSISSCFFTTDQSDLSDLI